MSLRTPGFPALGSSGLGPRPEIAASSAGFVPPPPLPAHLSRRDSDATRSQRFTVDVNGQLKDAVVDEYGILRVLPEQGSGTPSGYRASGEGVSQPLRVGDQVRSLERVHHRAEVNKDKGTPHVLGVILHLLRIVKVQLVMGQKFPPKLLWGLGYLVVHRQ